MGAFANIVLFACMCVGMGGASVYVWFVKAPVPIPVNTSLFLSMTGDQESNEYHGASQPVINAKIEDRLFAIESAFEKAHETGMDDRKLLHEQLYKLAVEDNEHYNELERQISNDETQNRTVILTLGSIITLCQAFLMFQHFMNRKRKDQ